MKGARLALALADPANEFATAGARSPFLDSCLRQYTVQLPSAEASFRLTPRRSRRAEPGRAGPS